MRFSMFCLERIRFVCAASGPHVFNMVVVVLLLWLVSIAISIHI